MTAADGLGSLAAYTEAAAQDVAAQNGQVPSVLGTPAPATSASLTTTEPSGGFSSAPRQFPFQVDSVLTPYLTGHPLLGKHAAQQAAGHAIAVEMVSSVLHPAGLLWTAGFPVVLLFVLGAFGALSVPLTFRLGRKRGRW